MLHKKSIIVSLVMLLLIAGSLLVAASPAVDQRGVLAGRVISLLATGTAVREGDILVRVETMTGPVPAARATTNGVVSEVLVKPGDSIGVGQVVARIQSR